MDLRRVAFFVGLATFVSAQTSPEVYLPEVSASVEQKWCPGRALVLSNATILVIGESWTPETPCYAHFNITPPRTIDPLTVSRFTQPAVVTITNAGWDDDLYIYLQSAQITNDVVTRPQRVIVQTRFPANVTCIGCIVETAGNNTRIFPAFTVPVGLAMIQNGQFHPQLDPIISSHQLYIGLDTGVAIRRDGGGYWLELAPVSAQTQQTMITQQLAAATADLNRVRAETRQQISKPLDTRQLNQLLNDFEQMQDQVSRLSVQLGVADLLQNEFIMLRDSCLSLVPAPRLTDPCEGVHRFAIINDKLYACKSNKWKELRTK